MAPRRNMSIDNFVSLAHRYSCKNEVATLLPLIMQGANRALLRWDNNWDAITKYKVHTRHKALMANCLDDVEFFLKLYKAWIKPPWMAAERSFNERQIWAQNWFVNGNLLERVKEQKDRISTRNIGFGQLDTIRILLAYAFPELKTNAHQVGSNYIFEPNLQVISDSPITCKTLLLDVWLSTLEKKRLKKVVESWNKIISDQGNNPHLLPRLFIEQFFPPDGVYMCKVRGTYERSNALEVQNVLHHPESILDEQLLTLETTSLPRAYSYLAVTDANIDAQWRYRMEVSDYSLAINGEVKIIFNARKATTIETFAALYKAGDVIQVIPFKSYCYPDNQNVTIAKEPQTQAIVLIPNHGDTSKLAVKIEEINFQNSLVLAIPAS